MKNQKDEKFEGKNVIFFMPSHYSIAPVFKKSLEKMGFDVLLISPEKDFKYKNILDRVINFFYKTFFRTRKYKEKLIKEFNSLQVIGKVTKLSDKSYDYFFGIRPDMLRENEINLILSKCKKSIAYQWDGLERFPDIFNYINLFDKFYIFDANDLKYKEKFPHIELSSNFFFDDDTTNIPQGEGIFYIGSYIENRADDVRFLAKELEKYNIPIDIQLTFYRDTLPFIDKNISFRKTQIPFAESIEKVKKAKILLDFKVKEHNGLSLRFFEALQYRKKIITNNTTVVDYDFYNPKNIFIINKDKCEDLGEFLSSDYEEVSPEIVQKYAFSSWVLNHF